MNNKQVNITPNISSLSFYKRTFFSLLIPIIIFLLLLNVILLFIFLFTNDNILMNLVVINITLIPIFLISDLISSIFIGIFYHYNKYIKSEYKVIINNGFLEISYRLKTPINEIQSLFIPYNIDLANANDIVVSNHIPINNIEKIESYTKYIYNIELKKFIYFFFLNEITNIVHHPLIQSKYIIKIKLLNKMELFNYYITPKINHKYPNKINTDVFYISIDNLRYYNIIRDFLT